ncbi:MAG: hypothetical protein H0S85_08565 [Desulfovibrionaceae bacterium]|jgi:DNA mismatch repair ATPase MutS|nr:hypothetical protein [Desulfovibrionaceae bacterium]
MDLQERLRNCLATILDLEAELERIDLGHTLLREFDMLKAFIEKVDEVPLEEEDVLRIETATKRFLEELRGPLSLSGAGGRQGRYVQ